jgi:hypothetical protein
MVVALPLLAEILRFGQHSRILPLCDELKEK